MMVDAPFYHCHRVPRVVVTETQNWCGGLVLRLNLLRHINIRNLESHLLI